MFNNKTYNLLYKTILSTYVLGIIYVIYLILFHLDKGFELSDESYYTVAVRESVNGRTFASWFGVVANKLCFGEYNLYALRLFKFVYQITALLIFCYSIFRFLKFKFQLRSEILFALLLPVFAVGFINYDYLPQTISYNTLSLVFSLIFWSVFITEITLKSKKSIFIFSLLNGLILCFLFFSKAPNAIILTLIYFGYKLIFERDKLWIGIAGFVISMIAGSMILFGSLSKAVDASVLMLDDMQKVEHAGFGLYAAQIVNYFHETLHLTLVFFEILIIVALIFIKHSLRQFIGYALVFLNIYFTFGFMEGNSVSVNNDFVVGFIFVINVIVLYILFRDKAVSENSKDFYFLIVAVLLSPLLLALGTNNSIFYTGSQTMVFCIAACVFILCKLQSKTAYVFYFAGSVFLLVFVVSALKCGMVEHPYRQTSLKLKHMPLFFSERTKGITEDEERFKFLFTLNHKLQLNNPDHSPITASTSYLGAAYLSGDPVLKYFWLPDPGYGIKKVKQTLSLMEFNNDKKFILLSSKDALNKEYVEELRKKNIDLYHSERLCDSIFVKYNNEYIYFFKTM